MQPEKVTRRDFVKGLAAGIAGVTGLKTIIPGTGGTAALAQNKRPPLPTQFQIACMTLPYSAFPLKRALEGIKAAGYRYVAWGTSHQEEGKSVPVMPVEAPPPRAKELAQQCRDLGLEPVLMFSGISPDNPKGYEVLARRVEQAAAAGIGQVLTFSGTRGGDRKAFVETLKKLGPICRDHRVMIVVKQHGGLTASGELCLAIIRDVGEDWIKINYDAGNVMDYLDIDPIPDLRKCASEVRSFCIKDHRNFPRDEDCGPGFGEIDHYKLLYEVAWTGLTIPLCCENISAPLLPRPKTPEGIDALARRAREFLETVIAGLHSLPPKS
ncbi:MAG: TIM barrel protein [Gemmatales bacterium]|nr:sugar phosphate isomerase/epimerase [Gemmatales bacterium]MCS7160608.1 sugar phosphate isomerase/epimerase [Gemmatales bacterium]MDW8175809.1 TIM barrel protein [Gemmatales bacterium]MDW8221889.1 TIM barrel protein [Gemmatales bacterium]